MNWQATDTGGSAAAKTTSSIASATSTGSGSPSNTADSTAAGISQSATASPSSGLSTGAKAAISVVVPIAVLTLTGALGFWLSRQMRRNRAVAPEAAPMSTSIEHYAPYAPKQELDASMSRQELETPRPELKGDRAHRPPQELGT